MVAFGLQNGGACRLGRHGAAGGQGIPQRRFLLLVDLGIASQGLGVVEQLQLALRRLDLQQPVVDIGETRERIPIEFGDGRPGAIATGQALGGGQWTVMQRMETEVRRTAFQKHAPAGLFPLARDPLRIVQPRQQIAGGIRGQQTVQPVGVEAASLEFRKRSVEQNAGSQRLKQRLLRGLVLRDIQTLAAMPGGEEGIEGPVLAVCVAPEHPPVLEFGQRLERARATLDGAQIGAADAGQIEDRGATGQIHLRHPSGDHALEPDRRALTEFGLVVAEAGQIGQRLPQAREGGLPLALDIGPEDCGGRDLNAVIDLRRLRQTVQQGIEQGHRFLREKPRPSGRGGIAATTVQPPETGAGFPPAGP